MTIEAVTNQKIPIKETLMACMVQPTVTMACSTASSIACHGSIKNAISIQNHSCFKNLNLGAKKQGMDIFTRSQAIARAYDDGYKDFAKGYSKARKKLQKLIDKKDISLKDKIENLLFGNQNEKITFYSKRTTLEKEFEVASENLSAVKKIFNRSVENFDAKKLDTALGLVEKKTKLQNGKFVEQIVKDRGVFQNADSFSKKVVGEITEVGAKATIKSTAKGFANAVKSNFTREMSPGFGWLNYTMTAFQFLPEFKNNVVPTFKNKGFWSGIKEGAKTLLRVGADLVGYASGGAVGRAIGAVVGGTICPGVGHKVGATLGDMFFTMLIGLTVTKTVDNVLGVQSEETKEEMTNFLYERSCNKSLSTF